MRHSDQLPLSAPWIDHVHAAELAAISALLDQQPRIMALVEQDLRTRCPKNSLRRAEHLAGYTAYHTHVKREAATLGDPAHSASGDRQATHGRSRSHHARPSDGGLPDVRARASGRAGPTPGPPLERLQQHRTGHSIDRDLHGSGPHLDDYEIPDDRRLIPGVGFSVEPGVYLAGEFGVRSEVNISWGERGPEVTRSGGDVEGAAEGDAQRETVVG